jgi:hypothetical protein
MQANKNGSGDFMMMAIAVSHFLVSNATVKHFQPSALSNFGG